MPKKKEISFAPNKTECTLLIKDVRAVKRVLKLVDGYLSNQKQNELISFNGGVMTWYDLRQHVQAARKLLGQRKLS